VKRITLTLVICVVLSTTAPAGLLREVWDGSRSIDEAIALAHRGIPADQVDILDHPEEWVDLADNYSARLTGWLTLPATGQYTFYVAGDDDNRMYVSTDDNPRNAALVAYVNGWTAHMDWTNMDSQRTAAMRLTEGQVIAMYGIMQEDGGHDSLTFGWSGPGIDGITFIPGEHFTGAHEVVAPTRPGNPSPADGATGIVEALLHWDLNDPDVDAPLFDVYGGADPNALELLAENITETSFHIGRGGVELDFLTTYYWKVAQLGAEGHIWSFTTETGAPIITAVQDDVVLPGQDAQLAVEATSLLGGELTYQWYREKVVLTGFELFDVPLPGAIAAVLNVPVASADDEGNYYCVVTNDFGQTKSDLVVLDVQVGLIHRYRFDDDASDSIGGADGVVVNNTGNTVIEDGQAKMGNVGPERPNNGDGDYIDLPNGLISGLTQMTVQVWATYADEGLQAWSRLLAFGNSNCGEDSSCSGSASTYLTIQPNRGGHIAGAEYRNRGAANNLLVFSGGHIPVGEEVQYTLVHDDTAGTTKLYLNGIVQAGRPTNVTLKEFDDVNVWLGRGMWNDPLFIGAFNECRIYDTALTAAEIALAYLAGPDELPALTEPCELSLAGDLNKDCVIDIVDAAMLADRVLTQILETEMAEEQK